MHRPQNSMECHVDGVTAGRGQRGFEFNFSKVSRQDEDSNSTFQKFPAKTRVRIKLFKSFPPRRGFESVRIQFASIQHSPSFIHRILSAGGTLKMNLLHDGLPQHRHGDHASSVHIVSFYSVSNPNLVSARLTYLYLESCGWHYMYCTVCTDLLSSLLAYQR